MPKTGRKLGPEHEEDRLLAKEMSVGVDEAVQKAIAMVETVRERDRDRGRDEMRFYA